MCVCMYIGTAETVDLCLLPVGDKIPLRPLPVPFDALSFDGKYAISVLSMEAAKHSKKKKDSKGLCRFIYCPSEEAEKLLGWFFFYFCHIFFLNFIYVCDVF